MVSRYDSVMYFDWGGLVRSLHDEEMFEDIARSCGVRRQTVDEVWRQLGPQMTRGEIDAGEFWNRLSTMGFIKILPAYDSLFTRVYHEKSVLNQPVVDLIARLKQAGFTTGLLSNTILPHYNFFRENPEWSKYDLFDPIIASPVVGSRKGDVGHQIYVQAESAVPQSNIFFIDDSKKYALDIPAELNSRPEVSRHGKRWTGIWVPDFNAAAATIEDALRKAGLEF